MDKMSRKPSFKIPSPSPPSTMMVETPKLMETISKWVPLICAGSAIGISMFALKEIKNTRKELISLKKEQYTAPNNDKLEKKIELMEKQLSKITDFLKTTQLQQARSAMQQPPPQSSRPIKKDPKIVKNIVPPTPPVEIKIINEEPGQDEGDEYEEIEVTDDEA